jgi:hypothetical protein
MSQTAQKNSIKELPNSVFFPQCIMPQAVELPPFVIPEGYMTGDEFARRVKEGLIRRLKEDGLIQ